MRFLLELSQVLCKMDVLSVRLADTVGIFTPGTVQEYFTLLTQNCGMAFGIHTHNDLGLAVANSVAAAKYGAVYLDTTLFGIGERAGNCDSYTLTEAIGTSFGMHPLPERLLRSKEKAMELVFADNEKNDWLTCNMNERERFYEKFMEKSCRIVGGCIDAWNDCRGMFLSSSEPVELTIAAAASLTDVMADIQTAYADKEPNVTLNFTFASSGSLQTQIEQGAGADVFISAALKQMKTLQERVCFWMIPTRNFGK